MQYFISLILLIGFMSFTNIKPCLAISEKIYHTAPKKDSLNALKSVDGFLKWYKTNYKKSSKFRLVGSDKSGHYFVDQKTCEHYLKHLKSSGYVSDAYLQQWRKYFSQMEQNFKDNPQNEGPPEGFDYDLVSGTQEPELFYQPSSNLKITISKVERSKVTIKSIDIWEHQYTLSKSGGKWKIDTIEMLGYPAE